MWEGFFPETVISTVFAWLQCCCCTAAAAVAYSAAVICLLSDRSCLAAAVEFRALVCDICGTRHCRSSYFLIFAFPPTFPRYSSARMSTRFLRFLLRQRSGSYSTASATLVAVWPFLRSLSSQSKMLCCFVLWLHNLAVRTEPRFYAAYSSLEGLFWNRENQILIVSVV